MKFQIDERLVLPEWAVIPLHAGTLTGLIALMAASAEDGGERTLKPADRSRVPCCPIHRDVNRSAPAVPTLDNFRLACSWFVWRYRLRLLVLGGAMFLQQRMVRTTTPLTRFCYDCTD